MAQRFGGRYSPDANQTDSPADASGAAGGQGATTRPGGPFHGARPAPSTLKANLLFILPLPLAVRAFMLDAGGLVLTLSALGVILMSAWLTRDGEIAHRAWEARRVARRPAIPRKIFGSVLMGLGLAAASLQDAGIFGAAALGLMGAALHLTAFGPDPLSDKGMEGIDTHSQDRAARAVAQAETYLREMQSAIARAGDRALERRVEQFQATARTMFRTVEEDPRDLAAARKYLTVYLQGARDATSKFADLYARGRDPGARADYEALLTDLESGFSRQNAALLTDNRDDLDVEIGVLRERLEREGIRTG